MADTLIPSDGSSSSTGQAVGYNIANMNRKQLKFKKRHKLSLSELMPNERRIRDNLKFGIWQAFPDLKKRLEYMKSLLAGLDREIEKGYIK